MTALGDPAAQYKSKQAGADDYVAKPVTAQELRERIQCLMRRHQLFHRARQPTETDG